MALVYYFLAKHSFYCRLLCLIPMAICSDRVTGPVSESFLCGAVKFSFRGLPLFLGGNTLPFVPAMAGRVAVVTSPSGVGKATVVTSKVTLASAVGDYSTIEGYTLAPRFSVLSALNISCTESAPISTGFCCTS